MRQRTGPLQCAGRESGARPACRASSPRLAQDFHQIAAILVLAERLGERFELVRGDVAHAKSDFLGARDLKPLPALYGLNEGRRLEQRFMGPGVEPRGAAPEKLDRELRALEIDAVDVGDLELAARRRAQGARDL